MPINKENVITPSDRKYHPGWDKLYNGKMSYFNSLFFIIKISLWNITIKPSKRVSIWLVRLISPFVWLLFYVLGQGTFLPFIITGFISLFLLVLLFEKTQGMELFLTLLLAGVIPLILVFSPFLAILIMGGGNKEGLGKSTMWNDYCSMNPNTQFTSGRHNHKLR